MKADAYAYRDRRNRKRDFRRLWITRINAAARAEGMTYAHVHPRPEAGRRRAGPQGPGRHRRARPRDLPPICRARPRGLGGLVEPEHRRAFQGAPPAGAAPFLFAMTDHQPPQRSAQGGPQARRPALARQAGRVRGRGRGPARGRRRRRLARRSRARRRGQRAGRHRGGAARARRGLPARLGHARARRLPAALGARPPGRCAWRCGASATRATSARCCARALAFGAASVALGPGSADPYGHKAVRASMGALFSVPVARVRDVAELPGRRGRARRPRRARRCAELRRRRRDARGRRRARGAARPTSSPRATRSPTSRSPTPTP